ncbi:NAD(P)-dependent oxidoreductase [Rhodoferax sediminis]|uniref:NAD(P)-dependent oxidoreductase n=1 Tax=Rhodoferax sediminis TaxID=2509614 RepID=A0A515DDZ1_9BURK|nr:NAD(P)-dependent oxidoreductase [Rhodoferax sediminis]QDL38626.1 NAD(P)-dependent oxidoreductase [Rhodoferax sediminis]
MSKQAREKTVAFVGLGQMGGPMAENLLKKGHAVVVYDIDKRKVSRFVELGAQAATGPADAARQACVLISMVDTTAQMEEVIAGPDGFIQAAQAGDVVISMSTIDLMALRRLHPKLMQKGVELLDSPVTGMEKGAKEGVLNAYVGGDAAALEKVRPVLASMATKITHFGAIGQGLAMKLINNMLFQVNRVLIMEGLALGAKAGLDPQQMFETISGTTGNSVAFQYSAPRILNREFDGIRMDITFKDVELQTQLAKSLGMPMFMANTALQVYQMARAKGLGNKDAVSAIQMYEEWTSVPVEARKK